MESGDTVHTNVDVFNAIKLYTQKKKNGRFYIMNILLQF